MNTRPLPSLLLLLLASTALAGCCIQLVADYDAKTEEAIFEKVAFASGLAMVRVAAKKSLQDAANAALDVFWKAVRAAL